MAKDGGTVPGERPAAMKPSLIERAAERLHADDGRLPRQAQAVEVAPDAPLLHREQSYDERRPLVPIDLARLNAKGITSPVSSRSVLGEEVRRIKRSVLSEARIGVNGGLGNNLVMVTSALPEEGKTFVSIALAMSLALERDHRVLLVDGDIVRPRLDKELGFKAARGLVDLLLDPLLDVADVLLATDIDGFSVLPAGQPHELSTELVASKRMQNVLTELSHRYTDRIVIFDSPPVLMTNEAPVLAQYMGQVLLVVAAEKTLRSSVEAAVEQLESCGSLRLVLNQVRKRLFGPNYYSGYYY